jgi:squalene-hopene/tetraprenyl-beta-curcumene cyclase
MMALIPRIAAAVVICSSVVTFAQQQSAKSEALARGEATATKAVDYLTSKQQPDGTWHSEKAPPAISAIVLKAVVQDERYDVNTDLVKKGYEKLLSYQYENGGIYKDLLANYNTAIAVSSLAAAENPQFKERIDKAVAYLKSLQWNDTIAGGPKGEKSIDVGNPWFGGFGYGSKGRPDGSNTQIALEALHDAGVSKDDPAMQAALKFVSRMQNLSETNDQKWAGNDGGGVYTPANNGESFAGEYTGEDGRRMLRSYGSMTYAMLKSYIYAGLSKDDPRVKAAWDWISKNWSLDENPGMRFSSPDHAQYGLFYYYMTLARALNVYDQPVIVDPQGNKHDWRVELIEKLSSLQAADGSFTGDKRWMEENPILATSYAALALQEAVEDLKQHPAK